MAFSNILRSFFPRKSIQFLAAFLKNVLHIYEARYIRLNIEIYTNGYMAIKGTGYTFCVFQNKILQFSQKVKLVFNYSFQNPVIQAELLAVEDAVYWVHNPPHTEFLIFSAIPSRLKDLENSNSSTTL